MNMIWFYFLIVIIIGYNQTLKTNQVSAAKENLQKYLKTISCKCAKIDNQNNILELYTSYHDASRKNGDKDGNSATKIRLVCKGEYSSYNGMLFRDIDNNGNIISVSRKRIHGRKNIIAININNPIEELIFSSVSEAARQLKTDRQSIGKCLKGEQRYSIVKNYIFRELDFNGDIIQNNINIEERIQEYNKRNPIINGIRHDIPTWGQIYNIKPATINYRLRQGWNVIDAITIPTGGKRGN